MNDPQVPPPLPPPTEPRFPGRNRLAAGAVGIGLVSLAVALLTLPTGEPKIGGQAPISATATPAPAASPVSQRPRDSAPTPQPAPPPPPPTPPPPPAAAAAAVTAEIIATSLPRGSVLRLDGRAIARRRITTMPGRHVLGVVADGFVARTDTVQLAAGQQYTWAPRLTAAAAPTTPGAKVAPEPVTRRANPDEAACKAAMAASAWHDAYLSCARAAGSGSAAGAHSEATLFQHGDGVRRSDDSASHWFALAARDGDIESMFQLAAAYERGRGVPRNQDAALDWYQRAANAGHAEAQYTLGDAFEHGRIGLAKDKPRALDWYRKAAAQGHKAAAARVRELER